MADCWGSLTTKEPELLWTSIEGQKRAVFSDVSASRREAKGSVGRATFVTRLHLKLVNQYVLIIRFNELSTESQRFYLT